MYTVSMSDVLSRMIYICNRFTFYNHEQVWTFIFDVRKVTSALLVLQFICCFNSQHFSSSTEAIIEESRFRFNKDLMVSTRIDTPSFSRSFPHNERCICLYITFPPSSHTFLFMVHFLFGLKV